MGKKRNRISTDGSQELGGNPFAALVAEGLPSGATGRPETESATSPKERNRGRIDVRREKAGRGGKTVTVIYGWKGISAEEKVSLAKTIQKRCGVGGAVKDGNIEVQGDKREEAKAALEEAGFRVVFAGG